MRRQIRVYYLCHNLFLIWVHTHVHVLGHYLGCSSATFDSVLLTFYMFW